MKFSLQDILPYIDECRRELDPARSGKVGDTQAENIGISHNLEGSVRRRWVGLNASRIYIYKAFLDYFTDATNVIDGVENPSPAFWVKDPIVGDAKNSKQTYPGTFRSAYTIVRTMANDQYELIQELRLGHIERLVNDDQVDWSEARAEQIEWFPGDENDNPRRDYVTVAWRGCSPRTHYQIIESLKDLDADGWEPEVNGNSLGVHRRLLVTSAEETDGSITVRAMLASGRLSYTAYDRWETETGSGVTYHFNVPSDMVQAVVEAEKVKGATARIGSPDARGEHDITIFFQEPEKYESLNERVAASCSSETITDVYYGLTQDEAEEIQLPTGEGLDKVPIGESWTLRRQPKGDGTWDVVVEKRITLARTPPEYISEESHGRQVVRKEALGYTGDNDVVLPIVQELGEVQRRQINFNADCSKDGVLERIISKQQSGVEKRGTRKYTSTGTLATNVKNPAEPAFGTSIPAGVTRSYQKRPNVDGTFDTTQRDDQVPALTGVAKRLTPTGGGSDATVVRNVTTQPADPSAPEVGEIINHDRRENDDGTWDAQTRKDVSSVLISEEVVKTAKVVRQGTGTRNKRGEKPAAPEAAIGERVTHRVSQNEDNTWDEVTVVEGVVEGLSIGGFSKAKCRELGTDIAVRNVLPSVKDAVKSAVSNVNALSPGQRLVWSDRENEDGTWDYSYRIEVAPDLESKTNIIRWKGGVTETVKRNIDPITKTAIPAAVKGKTVTLQHDENPDCSVDERLREEIPPEVTAVRSVIRKDATVVATRKSNTATADTLILTGAQTGELSNEETPEGLYNTDKVINTPLPQHATITYQSRGSANTFIVFRNWTTQNIIDAVNGGSVFSNGGNTSFDALPPGNNNSISSAPNQFGLFDGSVSSEPVFGSGSGSASGESPQGYKYSLGTSPNRYTVEVKITGFATTAEEHLAGSIGEDPWPSFIKEKPGIIYIGRGKFKATKVTKA